ncbi:sensor histidine kinase [Romboutsia sp. 1001713B170207_170306_H8]|uniref:sensor histidine kinase n=1 Tax=Romboutsia sp. 1001713B170207_170306_H8 TaxID=2787112 RepID=UPI000820B142|nr:Sensor histidine kinase YycG [uncultured Clostridium sp.]
MNKELNKSVKHYTIEDLEEILDKLPYQIWLKDEDGKYVYINKLGIEKVGLSKEDIIGKSDYDIRDYNIAKQCAETDRVLIDKNHDIYNEEQSNIDGQDIYHKVHKFIVNQNTTKKNLIGGIAEEISLDKKIQLELESNLLSYLDESKIEDDSKNILHSALVSLKKFIKCKNIEIFLYDEDKKNFNLYLSENKEESKFKEGSQIHINEEIENKLCSNEVYENRYFEIHESISKLQKDNIKDNLKIKSMKLANKLFGLVCISYEEEIDNTCKDDSYLEEILTKISIIIKQIENKDQISCINQKKDELESIIELESIKSDFFANIVSHEFRTPVNIILSIVQLVNSYINSTNSNISKTKMTEYLKILKQNAYRLLRLVNNIVDTAKISNNSYDLRLENHNIISIVENITMSTVRYANDKRLNIVFDTDKEDVILACDSDNIERIMFNLISNAIKFSYCNTDIEIKIKTDLDLNRLFVSVKNYGQTIDECDRERIFGKFTQIDDLFIRKNEGSGIGLFLVKKFVEMHSGKIYIDSIENATQITFYLPIYTIDEEYVYNQKIGKNDIIEKCDIELSDIYI